MSEINNQSFVNMKIKYQSNDFGFVNLNSVSLSYLFKNERLSYIFRLKPVAPLLQPICSSTFYYISSKYKSLSDTSQNLHSCFGSFFAESSKTESCQYYILTLLIKYQFFKCFCSSKLKNKKRNSQDCRHNHVINFDLIVLYFFVAPIERNEAEQECYSQSFDFNVFFILIEKKSIKLLIQFRYVDCRYFKLGFLFLQFAEAKVTLGKVVIFGQINLLPPQQIGIFQCVCTMNVINSPDHYYINFDENKQ